MDRLIVTIDGPSGTGKSLTAEMLSKKLELKYINSGDYYRAVTYIAFSNEIKPNDYHAICRLASGLDLKFEDNGIFYDNKNISDDIRTIDITAKVTSISRINALRRIVNDKLRLYGDSGRLLMEGKDVGLNVFPDADFKFFLTSDMSARVARRRQEFLDRGHNIPKDKIEKELKYRDDLEIKKSNPILKKPDNAIIIDTSNMIIEEQVHYLYRYITDPESLIKKPALNGGSEKQSGNL